LIWLTTRFGSADSFAESLSMTANQPSPQAKPSRANGGDDETGEASARR